MHPAHWKHIIGIIQRNLKEKMGSALVSGSTKKLEMCLGEMAYRDLFKVTGTGNTGSTRIPLNRILSSI